MSFSCHTVSSQSDAPTSWQRAPLGLASHHPRPRRAAVQPPKANSTDTDAAQGPDPAGAARGPRLSAPRDLALDQMTLGSPLRPKLFSDSMTCSKPSRSPGPGQLQPRDRPFCVTFSMLPRRSSPRAALAAGDKYQLGRWRSHKWGGYGEGRLKERGCTGSPTRVRVLRSAPGSRELRHAPPAPLAAIVPMPKGGIPAILVIKNILKYLNRLKS